MGVGRPSEQLKIFSEEVKTNRIIEPRAPRDSRAAPPRRFPQLQTAKALGLLFYLFLEANAATAL